MKEFFSGGGGACPWSHPPAYGPGLSLPVAFARHNARHCARSKIVRVLMFPVHKKKSQQKYSNIPVSFKLLQTLLQHIRFEIFSRVQKKGERNNFLHTSAISTQLQQYHRLAVPAQIKKCTVTVSVFLNTWLAEKLWQLFIPVT